MVGVIVLVSMWALTLAVAYAIGDYHGFCSVIDKQIAERQKELKKLQRKLRAKAIIREVLKEEQGQ